MLISLVLVVVIHLFSILSNLVQITACCFTGLPVTVYRLKWFGIKKPEQYATVTYRFQWTTFSNHRTLLLVKLVCLSLGITNICFLTCDNYDTPHITSLNNISLWNGQLDFFQLTATFVIFLVNSVVINFKLKVMFR